ncbi:MAG TPA: hypothetical protein VJX67_02095 [Blastocatellia bacterium]|nr:hypothetical protein [Blastocatellia bacterium]
MSSEEMLQALVALSSDEDEGIRDSAGATIRTMDPASYSGLTANENTPPEVLGFLAVWDQSSQEMVEAAVFNRSTPDGALAHLASRSSSPAIIEAISMNQQSLIRCPDIIEAIMANPARSAEAERRAREVQQEFFEKQFGAKIVAEEERARREAKTEAAETQTISVEGIEDLVRLGLIEEGIDDTIVDEYEAEFGPFQEEVGPEYEPLDIAKIVEAIQSESEEIQISADRMPIFQQIAVMSIKDRVMLAIKGTREARMILVRDPNRIVSSAVLRNPRLTDAEIESIAAMKSMSEDVLRLIGQNRAWIKSYSVIHHLVRNPKTPIGISLGFLNRIQTRDLRVLAGNKNIPDVIRSTASRLYVKRSQGVA